MKAKTPQRLINSTNLPMVFVHGSFANKRSWLKIISHFEEDKTCIAIDLPGHGERASPTDFENPSFDPEFSVIENAIFENGNQENGIHLIGHSYGGVVALNAALKKRFSIKRLTLFEPVAVSTLPTFGHKNVMNNVIEFTNKYRHSYENGDENACGMVIDFWGGKGSFDAIPEHIQKSMMSMTKNNLRHWDLCLNSPHDILTYQNLSIPVTIIHGGRSNPIAKLISSTLNDHLPNSTLHIIDDASHFMITSHPEDCAKFLK